MNEGQNQEQADDPYPKHRAVSVSFDHDDFIPFVKKLHRKYHGEWIALHIGELDERTGLTKGKIIAHDPVQEVAFQAAYDFHKVYPDAPIRFFTTDMVMPQSKGR